MSTASLPNYVPPPTSNSGTPAYTEEPQAYEQRLAHVARANGNARQGVDFVKESKNGDVRLRLAQQENGLQLPVYGAGGTVAGTVDLTRPEGATSVEVKIEGKLVLKEVGEGGSATSKLCLDTTLLWVKDRTNGGVCPKSLTFSLTLPSTFMYQDKAYPLPPTYEVHMSGVPGFRANIDYSVSATVNKPNTKSFFGVTIGSITVATPFTYMPRTRPAVPLPSPLQTTSRGLQPTGEWAVFATSLKAKFPGGQDIASKLYLPASRIYCAKQPIPFHLSFTSSAFALASFLPFTPSTLTSASKHCTKTQLLRQSTVDVRNTEILGTKTDIWRVDRIGEGVFRHAGDGPDWIAFNGEIMINSDVNVGGFKAGGLSVKDCIVLSIDPPDPAKSPFASLRQVVPLRLTTDAWSNPAAHAHAIGDEKDGHRFDGSEYSIPSSPDEHLEQQPEFHYAL